MGKFLQKENENLNDINKLYEVKKENSFEISKEEYQKIINELIELYLYDSAQNYERLSNLTPIEKRISEDIEYTIVASEDRDLQTKYITAKRKRSLREHSESKYIWAREAAAKSSELPIDCLIKLLNDEDKNVRNEARKNSQITTIIQKLKTTENLEEISNYQIPLPMVQKAIENNPKIQELIQQIKKKTNINKLQEYSQLNINCIQETLAENLNYKNCKTEQEREQITNIFKILAKNENIFVKINLLENKHTPIEILADIAMDKQISASVIANHPKSKKILDKVLQNLSKTNFFEKADLDINLIKIKRNNIESTFYKIKSILKTFDENNIKIEPKNTEYNLDK